VCEYLPEPCSVLSGLDSFLSSLLCISSFPPGHPARVSHLLLPKPVRNPCLFHHLLPQQTTPACQQPWPSRLPKSPSCTSPPPLLPMKTYLPSPGHSLAQTCSLICSWPYALLSTGLPVPPCYTVKASRPQIFQWITSPSGAKAKVLAVVWRGSWDLDAPLSNHWSLGVPWAHLVYAHFRAFAAAAGPRFP
jgi:hypothetical protein